MKISEISRPLLSHKTWIRHESDTNQTLNSFNSTPIPPAQSAYLPRITKLKTRYIRHFGRSIYYLEGPLVFSPLMQTHRTLVKRSHGLVRRPNLELEEVGLVVSTRIHRTLRGCLVHIIPSAISSQNVIHLFSRKNLTVVHLEPLHTELVRTCGTV